MPWNGSGSFYRDNSAFQGTTVWFDDKGVGTNITTSHHDFHDQDLANGIQNCATIDGQNKMNAHWQPSAANTYDIGTSTLTWRSAYLTTSVVFKGASFNTTINYTAPTAARTITFGDESGTVQLQGGNISALIFSAEYDNGNSGASKTVDIANGVVQKITMTATCALTLTAPAGSKPAYFQLRAIQDATGGFVLTFPSGTKFRNELNTGSCKSASETLYWLYFDGTAWWVEVVPEYNSIPMQTATSRFFSGG